MVKERAKNDIEWLVFVAIFIGVMFLGIFIVVAISFFSQDQNEKREKGAKGEYISKTLNGVGPPGSNGVSARPKWENWVPTKE